MNLSGLMEKKIGPVPVIYIAAGLVAILAVVAWRMKSTPDTPTDEVTEDAALDENGIADGSTPYAGMRTNGTVIVQPAPVNPVENRPGSNDEWLRLGAEWLSKSKAVSATAAYAALEKYLEGKSRSVQESEWIELVIGHQGFPPEPFTNAPPPVTPSPGSDGRGSAPVPSQAPRTPAMVAPSGLRATEVGSTSINVDCANVPGADGYQFYVNGRMYGRTVVGSNMRITGLRPGTTYSISTRAVFDWQNGPMSPAIRVTTKR